MLWYQFKYIFFLIKKPSNMWILQGNVKDIFEYTSLVVHMAGRNYIVDQQQVEFNIAQWHGSYCLQVLADCC